ncbi:MAG TPA: agmatinase [Thermoplasmata archaeon]|nr:agmatinase [Thermoplasmata archaeon]
MTDPVDTTRSPRFAQVASFARLPLSRDLGKARSVFIGVPWDDATSFRSGARDGPSAIRSNSRLVRPYNMFQKVYPFRVLETVDYGDIDPVPGFLEDTFRRIEEGFEPILAAGIVPFAAGGDHSVTLPILRAQKAATGRPVRLLHFDAHFDTWESYWGDKRYTHGTWVKHAYEEGLIEPGSVFQVGIRSSLYSDADVANNAALVQRTYTIEDVVARPEKSIADELVQALGSGPTYVSLDIDVLDPAYAPGTGTPEPGGMTSLQLIHFLRELARLDVVGFDLVEVAPQYDHYGQVTAMTAAHLFFEAMSAVARRRIAPPH